MNYDAGARSRCWRLADGVDNAAEETEQERMTAEALHEIADMPGEDSYGFYVRVVREGDVCEGQRGWAVGRRNVCWSSTSPTAGFASIEMKT